MYAASGQKLKFQQTQPDVQGMLHCAYCGSFVRRATKKDEASTAIAGAAGGALLGAAIGGPPGALLGGILGLIIAKAKEEQQK
jgi:outer membrane lipoprotein SlyB